MIKTTVTAIILILLFHLGVFSQPITITVDNNHELAKSYIGNGVQWSAYPSIGISDSAWERVFKRIDFMNLNFIRLMVSAGDFCVTYPKNGKPVYEWNNEKMQRVYKILDYCQKKDVQVLLGDWGDPAGGNKVIDPQKKQLRYDGIEEWDKRWSVIVVDLLEHLFFNKKYTCIKWYNLGNEPNGYWMNCESFETWKTSIVNLDEELKSRKLREKIKLVGPDAAWGNDWIIKIIKDKELAPIIDDYEVHWYAEDKYIEDAQFCEEMKYYRKYIDENAPDGKEKLFFMGEAGMVTGKNEKDQQTKIATFEYGVWMLDFIIQSMRAGQAGLIAWDLDDAMHPSSREGYPDVAKMTWKEWGMWDSFAEEKGQPERAIIRPWYYPFSLMSKYVPVGSSVLYTSRPEIDKLRATASRVNIKGKDEYTIALVNESDKEREVLLQFKNIPIKLIELKQFNYFKEDCPTDKDGFPVVKYILKKVDLDKGLLLKMKGKGGLILTSLSF